MTTARKYRNLILFALPALFFFTTFAVYPLIATLGLSLFKVDLASGTQHFVGLDNYVYLFTNPGTAPAFWNALRNNMVFFGIHLVVEIPVALLIAALLSSKVVQRSRGVYRTLLFIPTTLSVAITAFIWRLLLNPLWGIMDFPLLGNMTTALPTVSLLSVWQYIGIPMIFFYTALLAIPNDVLESATLDGAGAGATFFRIKLPLIAPIIGLNIILTYIFTLVGFDIVFALGGPAPGPAYATDILGTFFYRVFYGFQAVVGDENLGAAVATVVFLIILVITAAYFLLVQRRTRSYEL